MGRHGDGDGHDGYRVDGAAPVATDAGSRSTTGAGARLQPGGGRRARRRDRRRELVVGGLPGRVVRVRERPGCEPPGPLRRDRPRRARRAQPGDEPHRVRLDVRRRRRTVDDRTDRTRGGGVVRARSLQRSVVVRRRLLRRRGVDHGGPATPRSAHCIRRGAGRRRHTATARAALNAARRRCSCRCPAGGHGDGDLAGDDGRRHGDDTGSPQAARPRRRQPVRGVTPHRRHVRVQPPRRALQRPPRADHRHRRRRHAARRSDIVCRHCPATSSSCCSHHCGCSASAGTSVSSAVPASSSRACLPPSASPCRAAPTSR